MELKFAVIPVLVLCLLGTNPTESKEITHEDIKDAMLSLVHMMRENTDKLERHEARNRQSDEHLKKSIALLTKRMSTIDGLKAYLVKLDERVAGIEQLITQKDERERIQLQKTADTLEDLESRLEGWATEIETKVVESVARAASGGSGAADRASQLLSRLDTTEAKLSDRVDKIDEKLDSFSDRLDYSVDVLAEVQNISKSIKDVSRQLKKLDNLHESGSNKENSLTQNRVLEQVQDLLSTTAEKIQDLPKLSEVRLMHNETQMSLREARHALKVSIDQGNENIESRLSENNEVAQNSLSNLRSELANNAERVNQELRDLGKGQSVMVEMADHVLDTKKRLEHAYKILREVGELVMAQGLNINNTLNSRFDGISNDIMDNQNGALANLTVKMEQEMNQVWRQINVMYQQMMESAKALDKLHKQNEAYVNGTTETMDGMESKVGEITKRMSEVDTNLNYLLGRLSLVTQEFNQIKTGLGTALDNIKASFKEVQEKANDLSSNPGPHPVPESYADAPSTSRRRRHIFSKH